MKDPVCGMTVDPHTAKHRAEHAGRTYYFCAAGCRTKFMADPARYLGPAQAHAEPVKPGAIYTCPMHPEIRQVGPGSCPICGMALEPVEITAEGHGPHPELVDMQRRFWIALALAVPVVILEMAPHFAGGLTMPSSRRSFPTGSSSCSRRRWCCGPAGRSSSAAGSRS